MKVKVTGLAATAVLMLLAACGNPAATPERESETAGSSGSARDDGGSREGRGERAERRRDGDEAAGEPAPALSAETHADGAPMWAATRRRSAADAAQRQFERNGADFGATTRQAYIDRAHAFVANPPAGTQTAERRNGDRLMYDPAGNVFAVATSDGAPRTMFKPEDGPAYWRQQQERIAGGGSRQANRPAADE